MHPLTKSIGMQRRNGGESRMAHEFRIKKLDGSIVTYTDYDSIPVNQIAHVIRFIPDLGDMPDDGHSEEDHSVIDGWNDKLQLLMAHERANHASNL